MRIGTGMCQLCVTFSGWHMGRDAWSEAELVRRVSEGSATVERARSCHRYQLVMK